MANTTRTSQFQPDWVFNFVLKLAVVICLVTLAIGLIVGVSPLMSLLRSGLAFIVFAALAWAASLIWPVIEIEEEAEEEAQVEKGPGAEANDDNSHSEISSQPAFHEMEAGVTYEQTPEPGVVETAEMEPVS